MTKRKEKNYKKRAIRMSIAAGVLAVILTILLILRTNVAVSEWMASTISRGWIRVASRISSIFPFSLYEMLLYVVIIAVIALIVVAIVFFCKKKVMRAITYLIVILIIGLSIGDVYTLSAGFAYYRSAPDLDYYKANYVGSDNKDEIIALAEFMIDDFNNLAEKMVRDKDGRTVSPYSFNELSDRLAEEYKRLDSDYFSSFTPRAKKITSKNIMSHMGMVGVFFAPFGEANVNPYESSYRMPVTMAHELAHSKGVMRESEANLVAYWLTLTSDDEYLRYSGYTDCYYIMLQVVRFYDGEKASELSNSLSPLIIKEWRLYNEFWSQFDLLEKITNVIYEFYLKLQGVKNGVGSYEEPTLDPGEIIVPADPSTGEEEKTDRVYYLNLTQKVMIKAIKDRKDAEHR